MKIDHPSFFHSLCSTRDDGGSPPAGEPSFLSEFVGNVFALLCDFGPFLNDGTPQNNRPVPSSIADRCRNSSHTSDKTLPPKAKENGLRPCKQPEAMVKIINFVELPIVCGALL
ncbi:MAG: hypothetical protein EHM36_00730 [Deltaproteobacteria bacterium]|nr:MAG: hypothetical protein EHM36_00730 [Deltaproteobacteria bacterium]